VTGRLLTNDMALTIAAARQGVGLCYIPEAMVQPWLATGELEGRRPFPHRLPALP